MASSTDKLSKDNALDILITHVYIRDHKATRCDPLVQTPQGQYVKQKNRKPKPEDHITAYVFGRSATEADGSFCVEVPYAPLCFIRVPDHFARLNANGIDDVLEHLTTCLIGNAYHATPYQGCLKAQVVQRRHAFGYRPEKYYTFMQVTCTNRVVYNALRSKMSSKDTKRASWKKRFYASLFTPGFLSKIQITKPAELADLTQHTTNHWYTSEWFVAHEFLDDTIAFLKSIRLNINGWARVVAGRLFRNPRCGFSNAGNEVVCSTIGSVHGVDLDTISKGTLAHVTKMTFDIECTSPGLTDHPKAHRPHDTVTQISTKTYSILNEAGADRLTFTLGNPAPSATTTYRTFKTETALLAGFATYVKRKDVDIYNSFNGMDFDWDYLHRRACLALFCQTNSLVAAIAKWRVLRSCRRAYKPLYDAHVALTTAFKKTEDREDPVFKTRQADLFTGMANALGRDAAKPPRRIPRQDALKIAVWDIPTLDQLKRVFAAFKPQPSIMPWFYMHRMRCTKVGFDYRPKRSAALGNQLLKTLNDGRTNSDTFLYIKTSYSMDKCRLSDCAEKFLKDDNKDDLKEHYDLHKETMNIKLKNPHSAGNSYYVMYEYIASKRPDLLKVVCEYCAKDVEVTDQLDTKLGISMELTSMMKRYRVILQDLTRRAQQHRFKTNMAFEIMDRFVFNSYDRTAKAPTYEGAAVLEPKPGLHGGKSEWVFCLDFASLYPTLMRERKFCCSTYLLKCDRKRILRLALQGKHPKLMAIPYGRPYQKGRDPVLWIKKLKTKHANAKKRKRVADQDVEAEVERWLSEPTTAFFAVADTQDTILPRFLERMGNDRNAVKAIMKITMAELTALKTFKKAKQHVSWTTLDAHLASLPAQRRALETDDTLNAVEKKQALGNIKAQLKHGPALDLACLDGRISKLAFIHMVLDSEQKAIKIGMNSVYGSLGVKDGTITGLQEIAMSVTYCGRMYIFKTRDFCYDYAADTPGWKDLNLEVVYGVSV